MATIQKITPNLWFNTEAEEAAKHYTSIFRDSGIQRITRYGKAGQEVHHMPEGTVMTVEYTLAGQRFVALNGGPVFKFNESVSFIVNCSGQEEVDHYWHKLGEGGDPKAQVCGWLKDKFGLSWQVVPETLSEMLHDRDPARASRVMEAMLKMKKIDVAACERAYNGKAATV